jgi:hypothetical protein
MRRILFCMMLSVVAFASCKKKHSNSVKDIKLKVTEINNKLGDYTARQVDDLTAKGGGGNITGYFRDEEVKKIHAERFTDKDRVFTEYYFDDGMLIFVLRQDYIYNKPNTYTEEVAKANHDSVWYDDKKTKLEISRYFLNDNILIKWVNADGIDVPVNSPHFQNVQSGLWAEAAILLKQLKEQG